MAATFILLVYWIVLLGAESQRTARGTSWVTFFDTLIILGIAWIPCFFLLRIRQPAVRAVLYTAGCVSVIAWIVWHTLTHAFPPTYRAESKAVTVAAPLIGFAFLNFVLIVRRNHKRNGGNHEEASLSRLAWGASALACGTALAVLGSWLYG